MRGALGATLRTASLGLVSLASAVFLLGGPKQTKVSADAGKDIFIILKNDFIEEYKLRATIETKFTVDKVGKIHSPKKDGDMHFAGRAPEVQLPLVAEIQNARDHEDDAVAAVRKAEKKKDPIKVAGAWRIWCEHAGGGTQRQGKKLEKAFTTSNPDHVFEIHPVTQVGDIDIRSSFKPIKGFRYKNAHTAFLHYENVKCKITPNDDKTTTIRTSAAGYNIVDFIIESLEDPDDHKVVDDGRFVMCQVHEPDGDLLVRRVRMVFVKGTEPEKAVQKLKKNEQMRVVGIPRINLSLVSFRVENRKDERDPLNWNLPYEMIVVAVLPTGDE